MNPRPIQPELAGSLASGREGGGVDNRAAARLAWFLWTLSVVFAALATLFYFLSLSIPLEGRNRPPLEFLPVLLIAFLAYSTVGAIVASRRPENAIGWIFCVFGVVLGFAFSGKFYADYTLVVAPGSLPGAEIVIWTFSWLSPALLLAPAFLLLLFPDGRLPSHRWRPVAWLAAGAAVVSGVGFAFRFGVLDEDYPSVANPFGVGGNAGNVLDLMSGVGTALATVALLLSLIAMISRFFRSGGEERQQIKWLVYAGGINIIALLAAEVIPGPELLGDLLWATGFAALVGLPVAAGVAILKHRLYDIDLVINRTLVYGSLTACVVGIYVLVVGYLGALFQTGGNLFISLLATGIVAVFFAPMRYRLQRAANRLMYGERDDPYKALSRLGERLESTLTPGAVLPAIVETVAGTLKLPYAGISLNREHGFETAAEHGTPAGDPLTLPLVYQNETVGQLTLSPRAPGEPFTKSDLRLLEDLARQAGIAAHAVRLSIDLQRSRERLVLAREEERRRLRRDFHDGIGPRLAALTLKLETARNKLSRDPEADALLSDLAELSREAVADVRRAVHALRPPALDELGLVPALRETAAQYSQNGLHVTVEAPEDLEHLPAAVEVAAYRIAQEAMTNVARHAGANDCVVRFALEDAVLRLEVADDGRGFGEERVSGVGLHSMRERAEELGGACVVEANAGGGVRVFARLPVEGAGA